MLEDLETINWNQLHHAYGSASDIPQQLRALTSSDDALCRKALGTLLENLYHQGSRWEASAYAIPFLYELLSDSYIQRRQGIVKLLIRIGLGDDWLADETLPYDVNRVFSAAGGINAADHHDFVQAFYEDENLPEDDFAQELLNKLDIAWARDSYLALQSQASILLNMAEDADFEIAKWALSSFPWLPILHEQGCPLLLKIIAENQ
jgi:hypothetical protein